MSSKNEEDGTQFGTLGACQKVENGDEIFKEGKKAKKKKIQKNPMAFSVFRKISMRISKTQPSISAWFVSTVLVISLLFCCISEFRGRDLQILMS